VRAKSKRRHPRCFVIAEAGSNHNGSMEMAKRLVEVAAEAGADAVKFQLFKANTMYPRVHINVNYLKRLGVQEGLYDLIKKHEVPREWIPELAAHCRKTAVEFMATPFDLEAVRLLNRHVKRFKIATYESFYGDLIRAVMATGKELILSIGGTSAAELDELFQKVLQGYEHQIVIMQCVAKYPAPLETLNLRVLPWIHERYKVRVGLSDHTEDPLLGPIAAVALNAAVVEKHFTLSKKLPGPDHAFALEPQELKQMVSAIRSVEGLLGATTKELLEAERELYYYKRCYLLRRSVRSGHRLRPQDVEILRNTGRQVPFIHPLDPKDVMGRRLQRHKGKGDILVKGDLG